MLRSASDSTKSAPATRSLALCRAMARCGLLHTLLVAALCAAAQAQNNTQRRSFLYVWTGSERAGKNDFLATIDITLGDPKFGKIVAKTEVPYKGVEPHHAGITSDNRIVAAGGFHSFLKNAPSLFFFDVSDAAQPRYYKAVRTNLGAVPDDWVRLPNGGLLVSMMGNATGGSPGRIAEISPYPDLNLVAEHPRSGQGIDDGFNPHGLWAVPRLDRFVSVDLLEYSSTLLSSPNHGEQIIRRDSVRVWNLTTREIMRTIHIGANNSKGQMDVMSVGPQGYSLFSTGTGILWGLDIFTFEARPLLNLTGGRDAGHCVYSTPFRNDTRILVTAFKIGTVFLLNTTVPQNISIIQALELGADAGPHAVAVHPDQNLAIVSDYYLNQAQRLGVVHYKQDHKVRFIRIAADGNSIYPHESVPYIDFNVAFRYPNGGAHPHGLAIKVANVPI